MFWKPTEKELVGKRVGGETVVGSLLKNESTALPVFLWGEGERERERERKVCACLFTVCACLFTVCVCLFTVCVCLFTVCEGERVCS